MALVDKLAKLLDGAVEVEQLPAQSNSRAERVKAELMAGTTFKTAAAEQFLNAKAGLLSHLQVPVALPSADHTSLSVMSRAIPERLQDTE